MASERFATVKARVQEFLDENRHGLEVLAEGKHPVRTVAEMLGEQEFLLAEVARVGTKRTLSEPVRIADIGTRLKALQDRNKNAIERNHFIRLDPGWWTDTEFLIAEIDRLEAERAAKQPAAAMA